MGPLNQNKRLRWHCALTVPDEARARLRSNAQSKAETSSAISAKKELAVAADRASAAARVSAAQAAAAADKADRNAPSHVEVQNLSQVLRNALLSPSASRVL